VYAFVVQRLIRKSFAALSKGEWQRVAGQFADSAHFRFPGEHELAGEYHDRPAIEDWFRRTWELLGLELEVHDVVVRGWPWNTRACTRFTAHVTCPDGATFHNDGMQYVRLAWGKVTTDFLYEDTQKVRQYTEHARHTLTASAPPT
jgi:ketosteroid isomerase-like protein